MRKKINPTFRHVFKNGDYCHVQYTSEYVKHGEYINTLTLVYHDLKDVTHFFLDENGVEDSTIWLYKAIEEHAKVMWNDSKNLAEVLN